MSWPSREEVRAALRNPPSAFSDPDLQPCDTVIGADGLPLPHPGDTADVYQVCAEDDRSWAVKCYTRPVAGLEHRYARIAEAVERAGLPYAVGFECLGSGLRVKDRSFPVVKMEWVEGQSLDRVVEAEAGHPAALDDIFQSWVCLCTSLRAAGIAHGDLQHGNVLLVPGAGPGAYGLRLVDYDGMYVPALANSPSGEGGHPNYRHPARAAKPVYSPDLDRFPHLVVATALKALAVAGPGLREKYDTGDNLLFTEADFRAPAASPLMRELWQTNHPILQSLVGQLAVACRRPIPRTPWLDDVAPGGIVLPLTPEQEEEAAHALGFGPPDPIPPEEPLALEDETDRGGRRRGVTAEPPTPPVKKFPVAPVAVAVAAGGLLLLGAMIAGAVVAIRVVGDALRPVETTQSDPADVPRPSVPGPDSVPPAKVAVPVVPPPPVVVWAGDVPPLNLDTAAAPVLTRRFEVRTTSRPRGLQFTADNEKLVFTEQLTAPVRVISARTGADVEAYAGHKAIPFGAAPVAGGRVLSVAPGEPTGAVWAPEAGTPGVKFPLAPTPTATSQLPVFAVSADGRYVAVGYEAPDALDRASTGTAKVFDTTTGRELLSLIVRRPVFRFTPAGRLLVADRGQFRWFSLPDGAAQESQPTDDPEVGVTACSPDGRLAVGWVKLTAFLIDVKTGKTAYTFPPGYYPSQAVFSSDGRLLALPSIPGATAVDRTAHVEVVDLTAGRLVGRFPFYRGAIDLTAMAFSPDSQSLAVARMADVISVYDVRGGAVAAKPLAPPFPPADPPAAVPAGPGYQRVWAKVVADERGGARVYIAQDGRTVYVNRGRETDAYDAKTGAAGVTFRGPDAPMMVQNVWTLDRDRVALFGFPLRVPSVWDSKTGAPLPPLFGANGPPGLPAAAVECQLSPDGRYLFTGGQGAFQGQSYGPAPYQVVEAATGKVVHDGTWQYGAARFTEDGSRVLIAETSGRVRWVKLPTGEVEADWGFQANAFPRMIDGLTADGSLFSYFGKPPGLPFAHYLIDGKTGQVLRKLPPGFAAERGVLSADGRWLAGVVSDPQNFRQFSAVVADTRTGAVLARTPVNGDMNDLQFAAFTADGRSFAVYHRGKRELAVYELRGNLPPVPGDAAVPAAGPVPPKWAQVAVLPPIDPAPPVQVPPPVRPELPVAAALQPRWTVVTQAGIVANGMPQPPLYAPDGRTIVLSGGDTGTILTFDPKTGAAGATFDGHKGPGGVHWLTPLAGDRVASRGFDAKFATWDAKTGKRVDELKYPDLPPMPAGLNGHAGVTNAVSPGGRYTAAARKESAQPVVPGPLRILDTVTGKEVVKAEWNGGQVVFTADESRVFVYDGFGKAQWYKLPSGEPDGGWQTGDTKERSRLVGMSNDGRVLLYHGPPAAGQPYGAYLIDGKTGQVIRKLGGFPYQTAWNTLSADGRFVAITLIDFRGAAVWYTDVFEVATWRLVGRIAPPEKSKQQPAQVGFSPDGKDVAVFFPAAKELSVYALPEAGAPVAVLPGPPVAPGAGDLAPPQAGGVPELKARWAVAADVGPAAAQFGYDPTAARLFLRNPAGQTVTVVDARTGRTVPERVEGLRWPKAGEMFTLPNERIAYRDWADPAVAVWNVKVGKADDPLPVPDVPPGPDKQNRRQARPSPDGKFMAVARYSPTRAPAPFRVFDLATGKAVVATEWTGGNVYFTADSSRVFVNEASGRCRWFKLPSGEADGEWDLPARDPTGTSRVTDVSADGRVVGYHGLRLPAGGTSAVLDGKTGEVVRAFGNDYLVAWHVSLSADGRLAALMRQPAGADRQLYGIDVIEVATGRVVGRAPLPTGGAMAVAYYMLTPDGRGLVVHNPRQNRLQWFDVPELPAEVAPKAKDVPVPPVAPAPPPEEDPKIAPAPRPVGGPEVAPPPRPVPKPDPPPFPRAA